jgi:repressor LexA
MKDLTRRQRQVLDFIEGYIQQKGFPPSVRDIAARFDLVSAAGVHKHIKALVKKNFLTKSDYLSRSLRVVKPGATTAPPVEIPLAGYVAAGRPIEAVQQNGETLTVPGGLVAGRGENFALCVRGDSMIEDGILDGDFVVMEPRQEPHNGEVVVALINGQEATLKRFYRENGRVRLQPANAAVAPILVQDQELRVQGVVVGIWRRYG